MVFVQHGYSWMLSFGMLCLNVSVSTLRDHSSWSISSKLTSYSGLFSKIEPGFFPSSPLDVLVRSDTILLLVSASGDLATPWQFYSFKELLFPSVNERFLRLGPLLSRSSKWNSCSVSIYASWSSSLLSDISSNLISVGLSCYGTSLWYPGVAKVSPTLGRTAV